MRKTRLWYLLDVGGSLYLGSAPINREACLNRVVNIGTVGTPISMGVINCKLRIATGDHKDADYIATITVNTIEACPNRDRDIVLILGDTASDEQLADDLVKAVLPWVSKHSCTPHVAARIMTALGNILDIKTLFENNHEIVQWFMNHYMQNALMVKHMRFSLPASS